MAPGETTTILKGQCTRVSCVEYADFPAFQRQVSNDQELIAFPSFNFCTIGDKPSIK